MTKKESEFVTTVWDYYRENGRDTLPWRNTSDPYKILVSELMLQQTQVDRVVPKFKSFLKKFPNVTKLSKASLGEVLNEWQGLGYNRRAKFLHNCAKVVVSEYEGVFPKTYESLQKLPGIGPYTAAAVLAFAYNKPVPLIETNVRTVIIFHFFKNKEGVTDTDILKKVEKTLPEDNPKEWYAALMDYGTYLKKQHGNLSRQSKSYAKQSKFKGSDREIRGAILRALAKGPRTLTQLKKDLSEFDKDRLTAQLKKLQAEEMVVLKGKNYRLP